LNPNYATAHHWYSALLSALGKQGEALAEAERAIELDPLSLPVKQNDFRPAASSLLPPQPVWHPAGKREGTKMRMPRETKLQQVNDQES